ncbi:MAG: hypothetical protein HC830_00990 [Bacteroidetes bacterium]|nr:hypothetical protein [Bacteroidota bacterium]
MDSQKNKQFKLDDLKKENPFQVPGNYFDSLGSRISDRIQANAPVEKQAFSLARVKPMLAFAGGFAGLALILYLGISVFFSQLNPGQTQIKTDVAEISAYNIISELDEATIVENFYEEDETATDSLLQQKKREQIINYLVTEDIEISTIIDEL